MSRPVLVAATLCIASLAAVPSTAPRVTIRPSAIVNDALDVPPPGVQMGGIHFDVKLEAFADTYAGMTHFDTRTVQIDPSQVDLARRRVYLHELMHVAWHEGKPSKDKGRQYTEEEAIQALAPGLLKLLAENPDAVAYLRK
jgi:hypothetical protein